MHISLNVMSESLPWASAFGEKVSQIHATRWTVLVCAMLVGTTHAPAALSQSAATTQSSRPVTTETELRKHIADLEQRVAELEKAKLAAFEVAEQDVGGNQNIERRLAALEKAQRKSDPPTDSANDQNDDDFDALNVRAPFVVRDEEGKVIFRVDRSPTNKAPRLIVGDPAKARVLVGVNESSPVVSLVGPDGNARISMVGGDSDRRLTVYGGDSGGVILKTTGTTAHISALNQSGYPVAMLASGGNNAGRVVLTDEGGNNTVEAGTLSSGVGVVRVGPRMGGAPAGLAVPTTLMGKK